MVGIGVHRLIAYYGPFVSRVCKGYDEQRFLTLSGERLFRVISLTLALRAVKRFQTTETFPDLQALIISESSGTTFFNVNVPPAEEIYKFNCRRLRSTQKALR